MMVCGLFAGAAEAAESAEPLRVNAMTFNIRNDNPRDGANAWPKRVDLVTGVIKKYEPDFVGVQEAKAHQIAVLRKELPGYAHVGRSRERNPLSGEATPIFYRKDRWKAIEHETFWLSDTPKEPASKGWGNGIPRIATVATFEHVESKQRVTVLNTHFDHRSQPSREKAAAMIVKRMADIKGPLVVTGDFNAGEDNAAMRTIREGGYIDTYRTVHPDEKAVGTFSAWNGQTKGAKIDHVFVRKGVKTIDANIARDHTDGRYPSDHYPVWAVVEFAGGDE